MLLTEHMSITDASLLSLGFHPNPVNSRCSLTFYIISPGSPLQSQSAGDCVLCQGMRILLTLHFCVSSMSSQKAGYRIGVSELPTMKLCPLPIPKSNPNQHPNILRISHPKTLCRSPACFSPASQPTSPRLCSRTPIFIWLWPQNAKW